MQSLVSKRGFFLSAFLALIFFCLQPCQSNAQAADNGTAGLSQAGIERLLQSLEDPQRLEELKEDLRALLALQDAEVREVQEVEPKGLGGKILFLASGYVESISRVLDESGQHLLQLPALAMDLTEQAQDPEVLRTWGEMAGKVFLVLLAGTLARRIFHRLLARARRSLRDSENHNKGIRFLLFAVSTLLELIPIAAFAAAAYGLLPLLNPRTGTQIVALSLINAYVLIQAILTFSRLLLAPTTPSMRILPLDNESVHYLCIWIRRLLRIGVYGYFILEAALILGMPESLHTTFLKSLGLIVTLMGIIFILQNRSDVTSWLRGDRAPEDKDPRGHKAPAPGVLARRLGDYWHIAAIVLIAGIFGTWALEIEGGIHFLARALIMTAIVLFLASSLNRLSRRALDRLFKISDQLKIEYPGLEERANRYLPLLKYSVKGILYTLAAFAILQAWGLGTLSLLLSPHGRAIVHSLLVITLIIFGALLIWVLVSVKIERYMARGDEGLPPTKRMLTLLPLLNNVVRISLIVVAGMSVLAHLGINIGPLLAGAGVIGLAIGFGAQTLVRDVITGAFILIEDSIEVGDWVEAGGFAGTVEHLTIRTLTLRDLSGSVHIIPFGDVTTVRNHNRDYGYALIDAGVAYRENYDEVVEALQDVATELRQDKTWEPDIMGDLEVFGMNNLGDSAVEIRVRLKTLPGRHFAVRRAFLERMKRIFDERGIEIPFPHQTIWFGVDKDGSAPPMRLIRETGKTDTPARTIGVEPQKTLTEPKPHLASEWEASEEVVREREEMEQKRSREETSPHGEESEPQKT